MNKVNDEWRTPDWLFKELNEEFKFDVDLCATKENSKCNSFCSDYLGNKVITFEHDRDDTYSSKLDWCDFKVAFMNPPYSNPKPFIEKAWEDSKYCKIVCLVKCDPNTKWWSTFWDYDKGSKPGCEVRFFPKRIQFDPPQEWVHSGKVWKLETGKWVKKCSLCNGFGAFGWKELDGTVERQGCNICKEKGWTPLSGPSFSSALIIMDRRDL